MIEITSIKEGIVIDHIKAGLGMEIFDKLNLRQLDDEVAIILNANSTQHGKKRYIENCKQCRHKLRCGINNRSFCYN